MWHFFSSVSALHLSGPNSHRMQPDAPSNQPVQPQTLAHFQSIGSTEVELPHTQQTQLCNQLGKRYLDVLWWFHTWEQQLAMVQQLESIISFSVSLSSFTPTFLQFQVLSPCQVQVWMTSLEEFKYETQFQKDTAEAIKCFLSMAVCRHGNAFPLL